MVLNNKMSVFQVVIESLAKIYKKNRSELHSPERLSNLYLKQISMKKNLMQMYGGVVVWQRTTIISLSQYT